MAATLVVPASTATAAPIRAHIAKAAPVAAPVAARPIPAPAVAAPGPKAAAARAKLRTLPASSVRKPATTALPPKAGARIAVAPAGPRLEHPSQGIVPLTGRPRLGPNRLVPPTSRPTPATAETTPSITAVRPQTGLSPDAVTIPGAPTAVTAIRRDGGARVTWVAPANTGGGITTYTVTATPGGASTSVGGTTLTTEIDGLTDGTSYTFTVTATNSAGTSPASAASNAVTPAPAGDPGPVTGLAVVAGNAQATVSWHMPANDGGADLQVTELVFIDQTTGGYTYVDVDAPATGVTVVNLYDGDTYTVDVYAYNTDYYAGPDVLSAPFTPAAGPLPAPPASVTVTPGLGLVTVGWTAPTNNGGSPITGYIVTTYSADDGSVVGTPVHVGASILSTAVSGLAVGSDYFFGVAAVTAAGTGPNWYSAQASPGALPDAPTDVTGYGQDKAAYVSWTAPDDGGSPITGYTVTATGTGGPFTQHVTGSSALVNGLTDNASYTFTITATTALGTGPASAASAVVKPTSLATRAVGTPQRDAQPISTQPDTKFVESRDNMIISGNGRYAFFLGRTESFDLNNNYLATVDQGFYRYDMSTGTTLEVWAIDVNTADIISSDELNWGESTDFAGDVFAAFADTNLYVWHADTGVVDLASSNASGNETTGYVGDPLVSGDGRYLVFAVNDDGDMAGHTTCAPSGTFGETSRPDSGDLYRYDISAGTLTHLTLNPFTESNAIITCVMPQVYAHAGISTNGNRIAYPMVFFGYNIAFGEGDYWTYQLGLFDVGAGGSTTTTWLAPTGEDESSWNSQESISGDGTRVVAATWIGDVSDQLVTINTAAPTAAPVGFFTLDYWDDWALSGNGSSVRVILHNDFYNPAPQVGVVDVGSGRLALASMINGNLADPMDSNLESYLSASIDYAARHILIQTDSPNLLGRTDCGSSPDVWGGIGCPPDLVSVDLATGTIGALPTQELGCECRNSLGAAGALSAFVGDPVNTATGQYTDSVVDAALPASGLGFSFARTYNSANAAKLGPLGPGWTDPYAMSLAFDGSGNATLLAEDGAQGTFTHNANGTYTAAPGVRSTLAAVTGGYTLTTPDGQIDAFDSTGRLTGMHDHDNIGLTFGYTTAGLSTVTDTDGRVATFAHDPVTSQIASLTLPDGKVTGYTYDTAHRLATVTAPGGAVTRYTYDSANRLTDVTDPDGHNAVHNVYDASGRVTSQTQGGGAATTVAWNPTDQSATSTDGLGHTAIDYYSGNVLIAHVDGAGGTSTYGYDAALDLTSVTDPDGNTTTMTYNSAGNMLTRVGPAPLSATETWTYDAHQNMTSYKDPRGHTETFTYDTANRLTASKDALGKSTTYTYTATNQVATVTDPLGGVTTSTYDGNGNLITSVDPTGATTTYTYDAAGRLLTTVAPRGNATGATPSAFTTTNTYDPAGRPATVTDPLGHVTKYTYDSFGNLLTSVDPLGRTTTYTYDARNRRTTVTDPLGHATTTTYDVDSDITSVTDPTGGETTRTYDAAGRLASITSPRGNVAGANPDPYTTHYRYDPAGNLVAVTDPLGHTTTTTYDAQNRPVAVIDALGHTTTTTYDGSGNVVAQTDATGATTGFTFDSDNRPTVTTDALGHTVTSGYDAAGHLTSRVDALGGKTTMTYDKDGRVLTTVDPRGNVTGGTPASYRTTYTYDPDGNELTSADGLANKTTSTYDDADELLTVTDPTGKVSSYTYDADGRPLTYDNPRAKISSTTYDAVGRTLTVTDPDGNVTSYTYDAAGDVATVTTPRGNASGANPASYTTTYTYDADHERLTTTGPTGAITTSGYDADGRTTTVTDPLNHTTTSTYDAVGNLVKTTNPLTYAVTNTYDADNRLATSSDGLGHVTTQAYDVLGNLISQTKPGGEQSSWTYDADNRQNSSTDPRGNVSGGNRAAYTTTYGYDPAGNQTSVVDPLGHTSTTTYNADNHPLAQTNADGNATGYTYDKDGRALTVTDPLGAVTTYTYNANGEIATDKDGDQHTTTYTYDNADQLIQVTDPLGGIAKYTYDRDGNQTKVTNARTQTVTSTFDARDLVTKVAYSDGTPSTSFAYDKAGRLGTATDATGNHVLTYDGANQLLKVTEPDATTFQYSYDHAGNITSRTYPDGAVTSYAYNSDRQPTSQTVSGAATAYGYDAAGNPTAITDPSATGAGETRTYDSDGQLASVTDKRAGTTIDSAQITRDAAGLPTSVAGTHNGATVGTTLTYDKDGRLTSDCPTVGTGGLCTSSITGVAGVSYTYDAVGNRLTQATSVNSAAPTITTYAYNAGDELATSVTGTATTAYGYDADGNQTSVTPASGSATTRTFDAADRITGQTVGTDTHTYTYDSAGNRASDTDGTTVSTMLWDTNQQMAQPATIRTTAGTGSTSIDYRTDPLGRIGSVTTAGASTYLLHDWQSSVADTSTATGTSATGAAANYDAFGTPGTPVTGLGSGSVGYQSQLLNGDAVSYNLRARQYDPTTGRFLSRDPLGQNVGEANVSEYVYADDDPLDGTDPTGEAPAWPSGPDGGVWAAGSQMRHNDVLLHAYRQEEKIYGADNVYADLPGLRQAPGVRGSNADGTLTVKTDWSDIAEPDLVANGVPTPHGKGLGVWDVKPATAYGLSKIESVGKLAGYRLGLANKFGKPTVLGPPIIPETWPYYDFEEREFGQMLMFNGSDWSKSGVPTVAPGNDIADIAQTTGLIFYRLLLWRSGDRKAKQQAEAQALEAQGFEAIATIACQPQHINVNAYAELYAVGDVGRPGLAAQRLIERNIPDPAYTGPLQIIDPDPFPLPPPPPPPVNYNPGPQSSESGGGHGWLNWLLGGSATGAGACAAWCGGGATTTTVEVATGFTAEDELWLMGIGILVGV